MSHPTPTRSSSTGTLGWHVYRVQTAGSQYSLGVFDGNPQQRRCVVLLGHSQGRVVHTQDCAPLVGGVAIFDVPTAQWVGKVLEVGTVRTSRIRAVSQEQEAGIVSEITSSVTTKTATPSNPFGDLPYPLDHVERLEQAAKYLTTLYLRHELMTDLHATPDLLRRFNASLADCMLTIKVLDRRAHGQQAQTSAEHLAASTIPS